MGNSAMEKLANLIDYMQNLNQYLTSRRRAGLHARRIRIRWGLTMVKTIISLILLLTPLAVALAAAPATQTPLKDTAPDRYIVVEGDTLWSISGRFLQNPWQWPEIWKMNQEQIKNPNRIYPGDVIVLDRTAQEARLRVRQAGNREAPARGPRRAPGSQAGADHLRRPPSSRSCPSRSSWAPRNSTPRRASRRPRKTASRSGAGAIAYASGLTKEQGPAWQVFRRGDALIDPDTKETLGYEAIYLGEARVVKFAEESTIQISRSRRRRSTSATGCWPRGAKCPISATCRARRQKPVRARIVSAYGGAGRSGPAFDRHAVQGQPGRPGGRARARHLPQPEHRALRAAHLAALRPRAA